MVQAWTAFAKAPTNGNTLTSQFVNVNIQPTSNQTVMNELKRELKEYYKDLPEEIFSVVPLSPAGLSYVCREYYSLVSRNSPFN